MRVGREVGFGSEEVDRAGIERVPGEEQTVLAIEQRQRIGRVPGSEQDFELTASQVDPFAIVAPVGHLPGALRVVTGANTRRKHAADPIGSERIAGVDGGVSLRAGVREGRVFIPDVGKFCVPARVVEVRVRVEHGDRQLRQSRDYNADARDSQACVEEQGAVIPNDQIGDDFLELVRFVNRLHFRPDAVDLEPIAVNVDPLERLVLRTR